MALGSPVIDGLVPPAPHASCNIALQASASAAPVQNTQPPSPNNKAIDLQTQGTCSRRKAAASTPASQNTMNTPWQANLGQACILQRCNTICVGLVHNSIYIPGYTQTYMPGYISLSNIMVGRGHVSHFHCMQNSRFGMLKDSEIIWQHKCEIMTRRQCEGAVSHYVHIYFI